MAKKREETNVLLFRIVLGALLLSSIAVLYYGGFELFMASLFGAGTATKLRQEGDHDQASGVGSADLAPTCEDDLVQPYGLLKVIVPSYEGDQYEVGVDHTPVKCYEHSRSFAFYDQVDFVGPPGAIYKSNAQSCAVFADKQVLQCHYFNMENGRKFYDVLRPILHSIRVGGSSFLKVFSISANTTFVEDGQCCPVSPAVG